MKQAVCLNNKTRRVGGLKMIGRKKSLPGFRDKTGEIKFKKAYEQLLDDWPEFDRQTVQTPQGLTHFLTTGSPDAPPLVLLHGRNSPSPTWSTIIHNLSLKYRIYAIDTIAEPGLSLNTGKSLKKEDDYVAWLLSTLDALHLNKMHFCAHSFGGWFAAHFAIDHPDRVKSLTLIDPAQVFAQFSLKWLLHCLPPYFFPSPKTITTFFEWVAQGLPLNKEVVKLVTIGMISFRATNEEASLIPDKKLQTLRVPTQQLLADKTVVHRIEKAERRANKLSPHIKTITIENSSHFIQIDQPEKTVKAILDFTSNI